MLLQGFTEEIETSHYMGAHLDGKPWSQFGTYKVRAGPAHKMPDIYDY